MYKIAIVEDEQECIDKLTRFIERYSAEHGVKLEYVVFKDGLTFITKYSGDFDIVLMDIEMPLMNGIEAAKKLRKVDEQVCLLFVTNLAKYAIEGYAVQAMDFLVKPVEYQNLSMKLDRALTIKERDQQKSIILNTMHGIQRLLLNEIYYIEVLDHKLTYHTGKGTFTERKSISDREEELAPYGFGRCANSFLVNFLYIDTIIGNEITVKGDQIRIGRTRRKTFLTMFTEYMGDSFR